MREVVKLALILGITIGMFSCGVKKAPSPLYSIPDTALKTKPTPSPTPGSN